MQGCKTAYALRICCFLFFVEKYGFKWLLKVVASNLQPLWTVKTGILTAQSGWKREFAAAICYLTPCTQLICIGWKEDGSLEDRWWVARGVNLWIELFKWAAERNAVLFLRNRASKGLSWTLSDRFAIFCASLSEDWFLSHLASNHHL